MFNSKAMSSIIITSVIAILGISILVFIDFANSDFSNDNEYGRPFLAFDSDLWDKIDTSALLLGIITTSAAIVAVGFSINHITLTNFFTKYPSRGIETYISRKDIFIPFLLLTLTIIASLWTLLVEKSVTINIQFVIIEFVLILFTVSLWVFVDSFNRLFRLTNVFSIIEDVGNKTNEVIQKIEKE